MAAGIYSNACVVAILVHPDGFIALEWRGAGWGPPAAILSPAANL